jgi:hypothetical protein
MQKGIINYELADGNTEEYLMKVADEILSEWTCPQWQMKDLTSL